MSFQWLSESKVDCIQLCLKEKCKMITLGKAD